MNALTNLNSDDLADCAPLSAAQMADLARSAQANANANVSDSDSGGGESQLQMRLYNHWLALLGSQKFPSIEDLDPEGMADFGPLGVVLDLTAGIENPGVVYVGQELADEAGIDHAITQVSQVPNRSVLRQITDQYLQVHANQAPIGFEASFKNRAGIATDYEGIVLPFSSDGEKIDFIYGVIIWQEAAATEARTDPSLVPVITAPPADLSTLLTSAREHAADLQLCEGRTRNALYETLGRAYDFAILASRNPDDFAELVMDAGLTVQKRAPMVPVIKLVFGAHYDKARVSEYAAALDHAQRLDLPAGSFASYLAETSGGLKSVVAAQRRIRRAENGTGPDGTRSVSKTLARQLRGVPTTEFAQITEHGEEFALVLIRRTEDHTIAFVGEIPADNSLIARASRKIRQTA